MPSAVPILLSEVRYDPLHQCLIEDTRVCDLAADTQHADLQQVRDFA